VISSDRRRGIAVIVLTALVAVPVTGLAQQPSIYYVYDALNRLVVVVDQDGNAATYTYDGVGNILRIDRFDASGLPGGVGISLFVPNAGKVGTSVEVFGKGLAPASTLAFNGTPATIVGATPNRLATTVPAGATSGPLSVTSELGAATSAAAFHVLGTLAVAPATAQVNVARPLQFQAIEDGTPTTNVRWSVNGIPGGDPASGIITTAGLYTAPGFVPARPTVTIAATHLDDVSNIASTKAMAGGRIVTVAEAMFDTSSRCVAATVTVGRAGTKPGAV
jgi:YD repeat-containing protein